MEADLPVSARLTRFMVSVPARAISLPVVVDPVNEILATSGWVLSSSPTSLPRPTTMLNTPAGKPASCSASATTWVWIGLISLGLITDAQPAASADASLLQIEPAVLFHGAISAATPTGCMTTFASPIRRVSSYCCST